MALEDDTIFCYKCTEVYAPNHQVALRWDDIDINLEMNGITPEISEKDEQAISLKEYTKQYVK